jgi:hypothetical protein
LKISICVALLTWVCSFGILFVFWEQLPAWAIVLILGYEFLIGSDARIFRIPFMSESQFEKMTW